MITDIAINGTPLDLDTVEWSVAIDHGRNDVQSPPQASSAEIVLYGPDLDVTVPVSGELTIEAYGVPRFTGRITDPQLAHDFAPNGDTYARLRIPAMGNLALLGLYEVGAAGYTEETLEDRVQNILDETGVVYTANTDPYMVMLPVDPDQPAPALTWLSDLCTQTGATMCDLPDGNILFESYSRRGYGYNPATFAQVTDTFADVPYIWADVYNRVNAAPVPVTLPGTAVVWTPVWTKSVLTIVNQIRVQYGDTNPQDEILADDAASIATHELRSITLPTQLADATDAYDRAQAVLLAQSEARWNLTQVQIKMDELDSTTRAAVLDMTQGSRVSLSNLPQPAPAPTYLGVVEGWSESYTPSGHYLTVSLSDPRYSYAMAKWNEIDPALAWSGVDAGIQWYDVVLPSDLAA